jgi:ribosomal protein S19
MKKFKKLKKASTITQNRALIINKTLLKKTESILIYRGKSYNKIQLKRKLLGYKVGEFSLTKKLGAKIHDSQRNRKRKNKNKQKR